MENDKHLIQTEPIDDHEK